MPGLHIIDTGTFKCGIQELKMPGLYISLVHSSVEYNSIVGFPYLVKKKNSWRTHRRSACWDTSPRDQKTSVTALLQQLKLEPLEERRPVNRLAFMYKILNCTWVLVVPSDKLNLTINDRPVRGNVTQQRIRTQCCNWIPKIFCSKDQWNSMPDAIMSAAFVIIFLKPAYCLAVLKCCHNARLPHYCDIQLNYINIATISNCTFSVISAHVWDGLPWYITSAASLPTLCRCMKSHLFRCRFHWQTILL